ncbi:3'-5' exonuclease [Pikeienuella piscinae]|uniref:3'-5' exonuclease n=1 Tax=Pikeienuella piscinae TaxID=2748098 RepID=UPI001FE43CEF|nr:3'-5' exonuclease [Pikeienuella piscinae]
MSSYRFFALDVETACSDVASICQIGIACVKSDDMIQTWSTYVNPRTHFSPFNSRLHGIGPAHVTDAPDFAEAIALVEPLLARHHIIQHSNFDRRAIHGAHALIGRKAPPWTWGDSVRIARRAWPEFIGNGGHGLAHLKRRLKLTFVHHDAGEDARAAAEVVLHAEKRTGQTFEAMLFSAGQVR